MTQGDVRRRRHTSYAVTGVTRRIRTHSSHTHLLQTSLSVSVRDLPSTAANRAPHERVFQEERFTYYLVRWISLALRGMGTCSSKRNSSRDEFNKPRAQAIDKVGLGLSASVESPTAFWSPEPRVVLANRSDYCVSYWVVQEDKRRTTEHLESIVSSIGLHLNVGTAGGNVAGDLERTRENTAHTELVVYFLMRDHRMAPGGCSQPTQVPFPMDCQDVRVYGFFQEDGQWRRFKDKVYSIARENKDFHITALTSNIVPYSKVGFATETREPERRASRSNSGQTVFLPLAQDPSSDSEENEGRS